jgi:hypothetical protein
MADTTKTPSQPKTSDAKKQKKEARKQKKAAMKAKVMEFLAKNNLGPIADDIKALIGKGGGVRVGTTSSVNTALRDLIVKAGAQGVPELTIYKTFHLGRPEMAGKIRKFVKTANPDDRIWVKFDEAKETYFMTGKGANPPKDWAGYIPSEKDAL